tara:strand:+ start:105 stop:440 length:336 start_codon:yes stop_codon:yes gene_type:complete
MCDGHHTLPLETERQSLIYKCNKVSVEKVPPSKCMKLVLQLLDRKYTNRHLLLNFVRTEFVSNQRNILALSGMRNKSLAWIKGIGIGAFIFFLVKGLIWIAVFYLGYRWMN